MGLFAVTFTRTLRQYRRKIEVTTRQVHEICQKAIDSLFDGGSFSFDIKNEQLPQQVGVDWQYTREVLFESHVKNVDDERRKWAKIVSEMRSLSCANNYRSAPWELSGETLEIADQILSDPPEEKQRAWNPVAFTDLAAENITAKSEYFSDIYDREAQLNLVSAAVRTAMETDFNRRFHCVLYGPPGCGKTDMLSRLANALGPENEAFFMFDMTSTTKAGAQRRLFSDPILPPVMIIEEIEKAEGDDLKWLLGILDQRAEIRKVNARVNKHRKAKLLCLATVNDMAKFKKLMSGALASRFSQKIYCPRPTRDILEKILWRECQYIPGSEKAKGRWIDATLKYCVDENYDRYKNDPREIIPICLCGGERLLDGSYQKDLDATQFPEELLEIAQ